MVSKFEQFVEGGYAKELEENGYPAKAALLRAHVRDFREGGMPEVFPDRASRANSEERPREQPLSLKEIKMLLVEALSATPSEPKLSEEFAEAINLKAGKYLGDEVKISSLILPSRTSRYSIEGFEEYERVTVNIRRVYNSVLNTFIRCGCNTLGEIRDTQPDTILKKPNMGMTTLRFVKTAFERPQAEKQHIS